MAEPGAVRITVGELAERYSLTLQGAPGVVIDGVCALSPGRAGALSFCADRRARGQLAGTQASAVLVRAADAGAVGGAALIGADPALAFAEIARLFDRSREFAPGIDPAATVAASAVLGAGAGVAAGAVIEAGVVLADGVYVGPGCVLRRGARIGAQTRLEANVYVGPDCQLGARVLALPGAVIGARGFGLVKTAGGWVDVPQLGRVVVGDDVEIGANTCIDRGALDDTIIDTGARLDNQIQIAHNCRIGAHTAIAACTGIAGSTVIGAHCQIGGSVVINGHLKITDNVVILGFAMVTKSITLAGVYGSGMPAEPAREWRRLVASSRRLVNVEPRLKKIEKTLRLVPPSREDAGEPDDF